MTPCSINRSFRYSVACIAVCSAAPALGVTHWTFALDSLPLNVYLTYLAYKFYRDADRDEAKCRKLLH